MEDEYTEHQDLGDAPSDMGAPEPPVSPMPSPSPEPYDPGSISPDLMELEQEVMTLEEQMMEQQMGQFVEPTTPPPSDGTQPHHDDPYDAPTEQTYGDDGQAEQGVAPTDHVIGNPDQASESWTFQGANGYCGPNSISMLIQSAGGPPISEQDIASWAISNNEMTRLDPSQDSSDMPSLHYGMLPEQAVDAINAIGGQYGITAEAHSGSMEELKGSLASGQQVMIELDDQRIWHQAGVSDPNSPNHFVVVTGIDETTGTVFLNDPGTPDGKEESVPLDDFKSAWKTSDDVMITTQSAGGDAGPTFLPVSL
jgi:hypothetical protein